MAVVPGTGLAAVYFANSDLTGKSVVPTARFYPEAQNLASKIDHAFVFAQAQIARTLADVGGNPDVYTINTKADGTWQTADGAVWTSGFLAGEMWQIYQHDPRKA